MTNQRDPPGGLFKLTHYPISKRSHFKIKSVVVFADQAATNGSLRAA
jgi:hypothetical protein